MNRPRLLLVTIALLLLLPWLQRGVFVDDPLFLWSAEQILAHPGDFYGGNVVWGLKSTRLVDEVQNPPLNAYYLAAVARVAGFSEPMLHLAMMAPTAAALLGAYSIARRLTSEPLIAALFLLATPAFYVSSLSLMCDVPMVALWLCGLALWLRGIDDRQQWPLALSALLMGACGLTKYFGIALIPLCAAYALVRWRRPGPWVLWLLIPVAMFAAFEAYAVSLYGRRLILGAADYALQSPIRQPGAFGQRLLLSLVYVGGGVLPLLFWIPWTYSWRALLGWLVIAVMIVGALISVGGVGHVVGEGDSGRFELRTAEGMLWMPLCLCALFAWLGLQVLGLVATDLWRRRDAQSLLLALWVLGTFAFCAAVNWTINVRTILPLAPAVGLLVVRRLAPDAGVAAASPIHWSWSIPIAAGLLISFALGAADTRAANADREAAEFVLSKYGRASGTVMLWFEGHWGFQYYMQRGGAYPMDVSSEATYFPGSIIVVHGENSATSIILDGWNELEVLSFPVYKGWSTTSHSRHLSFYSNILGQLPFGFGPIPPRKFRVFSPSYALRVDAQPPE